ncbi:MAG: SDR family oxidoreductase [Firmicutes bacterium]|nr:SDR family oxidoreductase [Bacillota bacterium]
MGRFSGKVAVVTGGGSGIGAATAKAFALEQATVVVADVNTQGGEAVVQEIISQGGSAIFVPTDVAKEDSVANLFAKAREITGKVDIVHANAGIFRPKPITELTLEEWELTIGVNLTGVMLTCKYAIKSMLETGGGAIINTASIAGLVANPVSPAYCASKGGVIALTRCLALDYAKQGIRVNAVCPGGVDTPMSQLPSDATPEQKEAAAAAARALHPIGRMGKPIEIANMVLFLASDEASFATGQCFIVDGGYTVQ